MGTVTSFGPRVQGKTHKMELIKNEWPRDESVTLPTLIELAQKMRAHRMTNRARLKSSAATRAILWGMMPKPDGER